jgi:N-acetylmuramic acid 6-phosphate etherase
VEKKRDVNDLGALSTEIENEQTRDLDRMATADLVRAIHAADVDAVAAVGREMEAIGYAIDRLAERLGAGGRLFYLGAGTSGRLGVLDAAECPPTYSSPPGLVQGVIAGGERALRYSVEGAEDDPMQAGADLAERHFSCDDTLVGIAASGRTPYVLGGIAYARNLGAWTIGISCVPRSALAVAADLAITPDTGAEVVTGSTRMKAGTATKLVLNMLSTGSMVKLGYVYGNLMVNVQPANEKLVDRGVRIVQRLTKLPAGEAAALLQRAGSVRVAVIMHRLQLDEPTARKRLESAGGRLRAVIG